MKGRQTGTDCRAVALALLVVLVDQATKFWVRTVFQPHDFKSVIPGFFNLVLVFNSGAAFGFLGGEQSTGRQVFFVAVALVALGVMGVAYRSFRNQGPLFAYALALIAGGAAGNLVDRLCFGVVTDFLDFYVQQYHWPAFNVADSAITIGVGLFLLASWRERGEPDPDHV